MAEPPGEGEAQSNGGAPRAADAARSTAARASLYRKEAIAHQRERAWGELVVATPRVARVFAWIGVLLAVAFVAFLTTAEYTRKARVTGMLAPERKENQLGLVEVREVYRISKVGTVAGCYVLEGTVRRGAKIRVLRDNVVVHDGELDSLKRFKDDVREVKAGFECGLSIRNYNDVQKGDQLEVYEIVEVARTL